VEVAVSNQRGPAGASGAFVNSATESDGTADLDLLNVTTVTATVTGTLTADHIHGNLAGSVYAHIRAGEALAKGDPVYVSGSHGSGSTLIPIVSRADASNAAKMPAIGIMDAAVGNNLTGHMVIVGTITELDTAGLTVNAELYVAAGGGFTATPPTARAQPVARVERANANNGAVIVKVNGLSASDATGNTLVRRTSGGAASLSSITLSGTGGSPFTSTLTGGVNFANRTLVLPDASGTLVTLGELANSATITASTAVANSTIVLRDSAGVINITGSNVAGTTAYASTAGWTYAGSSAAAHRTALELGSLATLNNDGTATLLFAGATIGSGTFTVNGVSVGRGGGGISTNMAVGSDALAANTTGSNSLAVGQQALIANSTGAGNCAVGGATLFKNTTGGGNTALGLFALFDNISSNDNTALGSRALLPATAGSNTAVGRQSLGNSTTGTSNTAIGIRSGNTIADGTTANAVTTNSVYVGSDTRALASGQTNQIVIGHQAVGAGSNSVTLGNDSVTLTQLKGNVVVQRGAQDTTNFERVGMRWDSTTAKVGTSKGGTGSARDLVLEADSIERLRIAAGTGNVGIGTTSPSAKLHVAGNTYVSSGSLFCDAFAGYSGGQMTITAGTSGLRVVTGTGGFFRVADGSDNTLFRVQNNGNVGINTTSPTEKLTVSGNIQATGYKSSDGSTGATGSFTDAGGQVVTVKNGLITNISAPP
jgi:hypothetical protein